VAQLNGAVLDSMGGADAVEEIDGEAWRTSRDD
jgi:hypothetical protein